MPGEPILSLRDVSKQYGDVTAVDQLSFDVPEGSILGFLGPNGAGKTTTLRLVLDIVRPTSGSITVFGQPLSRAMLSRIGFLPEERGLYRRMTVLQSVVYFGRLKGMPRVEAQRAASRLLERVGLAGRCGDRIEALSKGLAQKVQLAATLINRPRLVLLDEPFSGLDPVNQAVLEELVREVAAAGATVVFSTHVMQHAERLCDQLLLIGGGRKVFEGTPAVAERLIPGRLRLTAQKDPSALAGIRAAMPGAQKDGWTVWDAELAPGTEPGQVLQACFHNGIELKDFEVFRPSLHDVFVRLIGANGDPASNGNQPT